MCQMKMTFMTLWRECLQLFLGSPEVINVYLKRRGPQTTREVGAHRILSPYVHHLSLTLSNRNRLMAQFVEQIILVGAAVDVKKNFFLSQSRSIFQGDICPNKRYFSSTFIKVCWKGGDTIMTRRDREIAISFWTNAVKMIVKDTSSQWFNVK